MLKFVKGDMFLTVCMAIGHGANCEGYMGAGIALEIRHRFPFAFQQYKKACQSGLFVPGVTQTVQCEDKIIVNMATQAKIRRRDGSGGAKKEWIEKCLRNISCNYKKWGYNSIAMPIVGCSLGGCSWTDIRPVFEKIFKDCDLKVVVYEEYLEGVKADEN